MILSFDPANNFHFHWCGKFTSPNKDWIHMTRIRDDYELMVVTEGTLYIGDHTGDYVLHKGDYMLMPPTPYQHGTKASSCHFYWLHFGYHAEQQDHVTSDSAAPLPQDFLHIPVTGTLPAPERLIILMKQLQDSEKRYKDAVLNRYLCSSILGELSAQCRHLFCKNRHQKEQLYHDILDYISWHIQENLRIGEIAEHFGYNEKYLTTLFKQYAGISLKQQILQSKTDVAKSFLSETTQPISQIAYSLGFSDAHNFSNAFRKQTGLSPSEYRAGYTMHSIFQK